MEALSCLYAKAEDPLEEETGVTDAQRTRDKPECDSNFVSLHHSLSSSQSGLPSLPLTSVSSQALGSPLPGTKRSSSTPSSPTRVKAGKSAWEPQEARILLESGKSLNGQAPEQDPYSQIPRMKGTRRQLCLQT